jgi:fluoroquinolone transport system ATP-binding protein
MINVSNLTFTYTGTNKPAIKDISFAVQPGEIFGFLGPSGAGKSTTQKILFRLLQGFQGIGAASSTATCASGATSISSRSA